MAWTPPSTWMISPVVFGKNGESSATAPWAAGIGSPKSQVNGARLSQTPSNSSKPGIDLAAIVLIGPAAIKLQRIFSCPRSLARYRLADSNPAFAIPIQSYFGQATVASKVKPTIAAPSSFLKRGLHAIARDL
ncbi:unannotated protein [freshwater metagenome]|uniref:Unannotated protein n=1 Tax=freshwater metagenome TaxID=449393 RepID=A0A6J6HJ62_9ZZZZ